MKKDLTALCIAFVVLNGCSDSDTQNKPQLDNENDYSTVSEALTGEYGGLPWGDQETSPTSPNATIPNGTKYPNHFGRALAIGDFDADGSPDIATSEGSLATPGTVTLKFANRTSLTRSSITAGAGLDANDDLGEDLAVIRCNGITGDVLVASAPTYSTSDTVMYNGAFALIYNTTNNKYPVRKLIKNQTSFELAGIRFAAGDINGDGTADVVYQSTPIDNNGDFLAPKVSVVLNICNHKNNDPFSVATSITAKEATNFGSAIYIQKLNPEDELPEIIIVDNLYDDGTEGSPNGAIYFYQYKDNTLVQSREPIIGEKKVIDGQVYASSIESVAFTDIDGDGDLDLIVGEPMYNQGHKREGRVRTYTNTGSGNAFDPDDMKWSFVSNRTNARFGSSVYVADVNNDSVNDLIVGAPGFYSVEEKASGSVHVFMGTKDGSIFSKEAFWNYTSPTPRTSSDDFGRNIAAADLDKSKGWLDLIVAAPVNEQNTSGTVYGRVDIFNESTGYCYTADKCHFEKKCYEANEASEDSKCLICDPTRDNFGLVDQTCEGLETSCQFKAKCDAEKGCTMENKPDGTVCADTTCAGNSLTISTCVSGTCTPESAECGNYVCDPMLSSCPVSCTKDIDCVSPLICIDGICTEKANESPRITMPEDTEIMLGGTKTLTASAIDPENDELTYQWKCDNTNIKLNGDTTNALAVSIPTTESASSSFECQLTVTDTAGNTSSDSIKINIVGVEISISSPSQNATEMGPTIHFVGKTTATQGDIHVLLGSDSLCKAAISKSGTWNCQVELNAGAYAVNAVWSENKTQKSETRAFTVEDPIPDNNPPVIIVNRTYHGTPGSVLTIDASKSNDPDKGDTISFQWSGLNVSQLSSKTAAAPKFTIPSDAAAGTEYILRLTVKDSHNASTTTTVRITVDSFGYDIKIASPGEDNIYKSIDFSIEGETSIPAGNHITVTELTTKKSVCTAEIASDLSWVCDNTLLEAGSYTIQASWDEGTKTDPTVSNIVHFEIVPEAENNPPVIAVEPTYYIAAGESKVLDASKSNDPDEGDVITYQWKGSGASMLDDVKSATPTFTMPADANDGQVYPLTLTVTDSHNSSVSADIKVIATKEEPLVYSIEITSPEYNATVKNPVTIEGNATPDTPIVVFSELNETLCTTTANPKGSWSCQANIAAGNHTLSAQILIDEVIMAKSMTIAVIVEDDIIKPVITSPADLEIVSVRPTISGTMDAASGRVYVWTIDNDISTLLCSAEIVNNNWSCTAGYALENSTDYILQAYWKDGDNISGMSDTISITTEAKPLPKIDIISPVEGSSLNGDNPVIFAGKADPGTIVDVYISTTDDDRWTLACTAIAHADGYWACQNTLLEQGGYLVVADDSKDDEFIPTEPIQFTVTYDIRPASNTNSDDVRGGSCSMTTVPAGNFGWLFLLAGFAGFGLIRRRKSE